MAKETYTERHMNLARRLEKQLKSSGTFEIVDGGFRSGGQPFTDMVEAAKHAESMSSYARFTHGSALMPRTGSMTNPNIEVMLSKLVAAGKEMGLDLRGMSIDKTGYKVRPGLAKLLAGRGVTNFNPSEKNVTVWDLMDAQGRPISIPQRDKLLRRVFETDESSKKLFKRFNTLLASEQTAYVHARPMKTALFTPGKEFGRGLTSAGLEHGFDGLPILNPNTLMLHAKGIRKEASNLAIKIGNPNDHAVQTLIRQAEHLEKTARHGGTLETFRALGLVDLTGKPMRGMVKGDVFIPPLKRWSAFMHESGYTAKQAATIDILTSSVTKELGFMPGVGKDASYLTMKANRAEGMVHQDVQSLVAYGDRLDDPLRTVQYTERVVKNMQDKWAQKGILTPGYRDTLMRTIEEDSGATLEQQARARRILDWAATGKPPSGDILSEGLKGIEDSIRRTGKKAKDPFMLVEASLGRHIRNLEYMTRSGIIDKSIEVAPDELFYRRGYGWGIHEDTLAKLAAAHGGSDLDDALRERLRFDRKSKSIVAVGIRSPLSYGESSAIKFDPTKNLAAMEEMLENDPLYADAVKGWGNLERRHAGVQEMFDAADRAISQSDEPLTGGRLRWQMGKRTAAHNVLDRIEEAKKQARIIAKQAFPEVEDAYGTFDLARPTAYDIATRTPSSWEAGRSETRIPYEDWVRQQPRNWKEKASAKITEDLPTADYDEIRGMLREIGASKLTAEQYDRLMLNESHMGLLGRVFNANMVADSMREHMDKLGLHHLIPSINPEDIIDPLTQGSDEISPHDIELQLRAMTEGIANAIGHGAKVSRDLFEQRMGNGEGFWDRVHAINPAITREHPDDAFLDLSDPEQATMDIFHQANLNLHLTQISAASRADDIQRENYVTQTVKDKLFGPQHYEAADELWKRFQEAEINFKQPGSMYVGADPTEKFISSMLEDEHTPRQRAIDTLAYHLQSYFSKDTGEFTDEGVNVLGALLQRRGSRLSGIFQKGGMSDVMSYASQKLDTGVSPGARPRLDVFREAQNFEGLPDEVLRAIPGARRRDVLKESFGAAAGVLKDFGPEGGGVGKAIFRRDTTTALKELIDIPLARKGGLIAAGLIGFSAIYSKLRDRTPEDMQGPAMLPGGSAYERMPDPRTIGLYTGAQTSVNGTNYNINATGTFNPTSFNNDLQQIVGSNTQMTSNYYHGANVSKIPRPRFLQKMKNNGIN